MPAVTPKNNFGSPSARKSFKDEISRNSYPIDIHTAKNEISKAKKGKAKKGKKVSKTGKSAKSSKPLKPGAAKATTDKSAPKKQ